MKSDPPPPPTILAETTLCTVEDRGDGTYDVHLGTVILRLDRRALASFAGTLNRVVRKVFPRPEGARPARTMHLRLVRGEDEDGA